MQNFGDIFETRKQLFVSSFSIWMTVPMSLWSWFIKIFLQLSCVHCAIKVALGIIELLPIFRNAMSLGKCGKDNQMAFMFNSEYTVSFLWFWQSFWIAFNCMLALDLPLNSAKHQTGRNNLLWTISVTHRIKTVFYSIHYKNNWLAASDLFHMITQSI